MNPDWKSLPSLSALRAFDAVARCGSFSRAARSLNVTHAAVAQQIRGLETRLGAQLVQRAGRGVVLTEAGERLARPTLDAFSTLAAGIAAFEATEARRGIRGTTTTYIVDALILPNLGDFWRRHPGVEVSFVPGPCHDPVDFEGFDFAIRAGTGPWADYVAEPLIDCAIAFCAAPSLAGRGEADPAAIPWLLSDGPSPEANALASAGLDVAQLRRVDVGNLSYEIEAARQGYGATVAPEIIVERFLADGSLVHLPLQVEERARYSVILPSGPVRPVVRQFVDWLKGCV